MNSLIMAVIFIEKFEFNYLILDNLKYLFSFRLSISIWS